MRHLFAACIALVVLVILPPKGEAQSPGAVGPDQILGSIVGLRSYVPSDARTAFALGTERQGSGVILDSNGLVLTIGYLILEAERAEILRQDGEVVPADLVGYDHNTGFGLLRAREPLGGTSAKLGKSSILDEGDTVVSIALGGERPITPARVVSRRTFAGYWEYLLEDAIFTSPPNPFFGGAALFDQRGQLVGIGSLIVPDAGEAGVAMAGNMFVPIDELKPILADMLLGGRGGGRQNPWLGVYMAENDGVLVVTRVATESPAEKAGVREGHVLFKVDGKTVRSLADFYRKVWAIGPPGVDVDLELLSLVDGVAKQEMFTLTSMDRYDWLRLK